jgi:TolB-like protein
MRTRPVFLSLLGGLLAVALSAGAAVAGEADAASLARRNAESATRGGALDPGAGALAAPMGKAYVDGARRPVAGASGLPSGVLAPDGGGGYVWVGTAAPVPAPSEEHAAAREIRLQIREMAAQLFERGTTGLGGGVALPASFVNQDDMDSSSAFGRYIAEQMFYELNQLGIPVREYRTMPSVLTRPEQGEFVITRDMAKAARPRPAGLALSGTYYFDKHNVFVNARLFNTKDGLVLRTANMVFPQTPVTRAMLTKGGGMRLRAAQTEVRSLADMKDDTSLQFMLQQNTLH